MFKMTPNTEAIDSMIDAVRRFATYRGELVEALRWMGNTASERLKQGHPPGGPHPGPGELPVYGTHAYIDRTGWLTASMGFTLEPYRTWDPKTGTASALPTLYIFATAPHADAVEWGVPGHSRPYPFFWPLIEELLPLAMERVANVMAVANAQRET